MHSPVRRAAPPSRALRLQRAIGNGAVAALVQRQGGEGQILLSPERMAQTYAAWLHYYGKGAPTRQDHDKALARTQAKVGPLNWKRFKEYGLPRWISAAEIRREEAKLKAEQEAESQDPMGDLYAGLRTRANELNHAATQLSSNVAQAEYFTHKLRSPEGAKGVAYQLAAGTLGTYAAVKHAKDYATKKVDPIGGVIDWGTDLALSETMGKGRKKKDPTFEEAAEQFGQMAGTSVELMTGQLHDLYKQTRPSYGRFMAALTAFGNARSGFWRAGRLDTMTEHLGTMTTKLKAMGSAAQEYLMTCDALGIRRKVDSLVALDKAIITALKASVSSAVGKLGGLSPVSDVADGAADKVRDKLGYVVPKPVDTSLAENLATATGKAAGKATGVPMGLPKEATEKSAADDEKQ